MRLQLDMTGLHGEASEGHTRQRTGFRLERPYSCLQRPLPQVQEDVLPRARLYQLGRWPAAAALVMSRSHRAGTSTYSALHVAAACVRGSLL